ncbi:MAG: tripartite tricarboxylate transporter TctB family protein [Burkholderiales bacterium]|nr:tripartite tricarboxylate transporter TctB family protein [Burkholderiales bacterium]
MPPEGQPAKRTDRGTLVVTALLFALAVAAFWQSRDFSPLGAIFPRAIAAVLLLACVITLWRVLRGRTRPARGMLQEGVLRGVLLIAIIALWIALLEPAGFRVAGIVAYLALALVTVREPLTIGRIARYLLVAIAFVVVFELLFVHALKVPLPAGTLFAGTLN